MDGCYICSEECGDFGMGAIDVAMAVGQKKIKFEGHATDDRGEMVTLCKKCTANMLATCTKAVIESHSPKISKTH